MLFASKATMFMAYCSIKFISMDSILPTDLIKMLACPICKGDLIPGVTTLVLLCKACSREYPVIEGVPVLLPDGAGAACRTRGEAA